MGQVWQLEKLPLGLPILALLVLGLLPSCPDHSHMWAVR